MYGFLGPHPLPLYNLNSGFRLPPKVQYLKGFFFSQQVNSSKVDELTFINNPTILKSVYVAAVEDMAPDIANGGKTMSHDGHLVANCLDL